jgi:hypothetical protein
MRSTKEISEVTKVVIFVSMGYYSYIALMSRGNPITSDKETINQLETDSVG